MRLRRLFFLAIGILPTLAAPASHAEEVTVGHIAGSAVSVEGLVQADVNWFDNDRADLDGDGEAKSGRARQLRRAELVLKGKAPAGLDWVAGYDAKAEKWLDVNARYRFGEGRHALQFGQYKQPNSLEENTSSWSNDFISKAMVTNTFALGRRLGVGYGYRAADWGLMVSAFGDELDEDGVKGKGIAARGRFVPVNETGLILHFGLSHARHRAEQAGTRPGGEEVACFRSRPNADLAAIRLVDTGPLPFSERIDTTGVEALWAQGPLKLQAEYVRSRVARSNGLPDFAGKGAYASALWNLTGETWGYKDGIPTTPSATAPGRGLWQLGVRRDAIDLDDGPVAGGRMDAWTFGANWYWQRHFKVAFNHVVVSSERGGIRDNPDITELRLQFQW